MTHQEDAFKYPFRNVVDSKMTTLAIIKRDICKIGQIVVEVKHKPLEAALEVYGRHRYPKTLEDLLAILKNGESQKWPYQTELKAPWNNYYIFQISCYERGDGMKEGFLPITRRLTKASVLWYELIEILEFIPPIEINDFIPRS